MLGERTSPSLDNSEEARAFLQARLALFWKILFWLMAAASGLGAVGALKRPGPDLLLDVVLAALAGAFWWLCRGGERSVRFLRALEAAGILLFFSASSFIGRYVLVGFLRERGLGTAEGALMADAYLSVLGLTGTALMIAVRAAVVPSSPRRTLLVTTLVGVPALLTPTLLVPVAQGGFKLRELASGAYPWFPAALAMVWTFVVVTCVVTSRVIYGLRAQVREARRLGQYVIEEKIGEGGMGEVYRARHGMMRRPSALKLLRADRAEERDLMRFEREVQLTARLTHPNTITIFDYGRTDEGVFYYAMELLNGANLQRVVEVSGPLPESRVVRILKMACGALIEAHAIGLIHRDIKPANIMLCTQGLEPDVVKLLDFGLVKELAGNGDANVSVASNVVGTPHYMAPESILSPGAVDARADIYALGAVAYFLLAGREVFDGTSIVQVCSQHLYQEVTPLTELGVTVSPELERIVRDCLAKKPEARPASAADLRRRLEACPVEVWDAEQARLWWSEHAQALEARRSSKSASERTIAVDGRSRAKLLPET
ncbi:MAG: serine/threonine-protein kinase [Myxococcales bacterium]